MRKTAFVLVTFLFVLSVNLFGEETEKKLHVQPWFRLTFGRVASSPIDSQSYDYVFEDESLLDIDGGVRFLKPFNRFLLGRLNFGFRIKASTVRQKNWTSAELTGKKMVPFLLDAALQATFTGLLPENRKDSLVMEFGYFPFKYNDQSTNLGEYLFRTGTYPQYIISGFEHSIDKPKLCGMHISHSMQAGGLIKQDLIVNTELESYPLHDLNLTYLAAYTPHPFVTIGAGVQLAHLVSFNERKTTPGTDTVLYNLQSPDDRKWIAYVDPATDDTTLYTFRGTKIMGRATLDFKALFGVLPGETSLFGKEDFKIYGEAAILGVKNYPGWYENITERIPIMAGINIPTFKLLDVLSFEIERFQMRYRNSQEFIWKSTSPVPYTGSSGGSYIQQWQNDSLARILEKTDDDWKWSVYAAKTIGSHLRISAQVASDHTPRNWYTPGPPSYVKYTEMVPRTKDWYFMTRATLFF